MTDTETTQEAQTPTTDPLRTVQKILKQFESLPQEEQDYCVSKIEKLLAKRSN